MSVTRGRSELGVSLLIVDAKGLQNACNGCVVGRVNEDLELIFVLFKGLNLHLLRDVVHKPADAQSSELWRYGV